MSTLQRRKNDVTLQEALQEMLRYYKLEGRYKEMQLRAVWDQVMGKTIATYTADFTVRHQVLYLSILSAPLRQELQYSKERLCTLLNEHMGEPYLKGVIIR